MESVNQLLLDLMYHNTREDEDKIYLYGYCLPKYACYQWVIWECLSRADPHGRIWQPREARKDHACVRGCVIKNGETYFIYEAGYGGFSGRKVCPRCLAMIFYTTGVGDLPAVRGKEWTQEDQDRAENEHKKRMDEIAKGNEKWEAQMTKYRRGTDLVE